MPTAFKGEKINFYQHFSDRINTNGFKWYALLSQTLMKIDTKG